jgi:alcohol dehydrogenase (cytochrome c)
MFNGSYTGDRWQDLNEIDVSNVKNLKVACRFPTGETGAFQAGPVIADGIVYFTSVNTTYAINATNCKSIWKSTYVPATPLNFNTNRGVALDNGKLYRDTQDCHLLALDAASGKMLWNVNVCDSTKGDFLSAAPIVWDDTVYVGIAGADWGARGRMMAFGAGDGHQVWSFDLIPTGNEAGADTWGKASAAATGGGSTWTTYTLDPQTGELFVPVGNPAPDFSGDYRPGANLYTCSLVVLDAKSGQLKWYYQLSPHDVHDYDLGAAPMLITTAAGKNLVVFGGKNGFVYGLDRATHAVVFKTAVGTILNQNSAATVQGSQVCPGWVGGVEWNGPAYAVDRNEVIVGSNEWCGKYVLGEARYVAGKFFLGGSFVPAPYAQSHGWVTALNADTGKIVWQDKTPGPALAGVSPTSGGVTFTGDMGGTFFAFDSKSGKILYQHKTSGAMAGGVVAYRDRGKEYVVATSGNVSRSIWPGATGSATIYIFTL